MKSSLTTNEHTYNSTSAWNNSSVYGRHGYGGQQQYPHQYVDPQMPYNDSEQYRTATGQQYVVVPSACYRHTAADTPGLGSCLDDAVLRHRPPSADSAHQPDNMAVTGSYASSGTGSAYSGGCVDARQLPYVVGDHLQHWMSHGLCSPQDFSLFQSGQTSFRSRYNTTHNIYNFFHHHAMIEQHIN